MNKEIKKDKQSNTINEPKKNPADPRKNPRPGYDEKNPTQKEIDDSVKNNNSRKNR